MVITSTTTNTTQHLQKTIATAQGWNKEARIEVVVMCQLNEDVLMARTRPSYSVPIMSNGTVRIGKVVNLENDTVRCVHGTFIH